MERDIFAVCDLEVAYAYHLMEYLGSKKNIPFEIRVFTSTEILLEYARNHSIKVLLITENAMNEEVSKQQIGQIIILSEGVLSEKLKKYPSVYKYQSSQQLIREGMTNYGEICEWDGQKISAGKKKTEIIGIYSPIGRTMKTTFAITLGQILAKSQAVIYINMEVYSGFEFLLNRTYEHTLGDVLYYLHQGTQNIMGKINSMIQTMNNLDYLPPVLSPEDLLQTPIQEWITLFLQLSDYSNYETIVLDLGDGLADVLQILELCSKIYVPVRTDPMSQAKLVQFEERLKITGKERVLERMEKIQLPYHRTIQGGTGFLEDLVWSELGDYVRELIREKKEKEEIDWNGN